ncbi:MULTISPECIES: transposase family protein [unclassified Streptomyces]|uniref:helix-turn-helix domain-containing protein n=1 Tax=unclassified Streptomyces TaxID=2593676 RepID=UPI00365C0E33
MVTLVHLRLGLPHAALAELYGVDRSTVSAAIREVCPLLAAHGFAYPAPGAAQNAVSESRQPGPRRRSTMVLEPARNSVTRTFSCVVRDGNPVSREGKSWI